MTLSFPGLITTPFAPGRFYVSKHREQVIQVVYNTWYVLQVVSRQFLLQMFCHSLYSGHFHFTGLADIWILNFVISIRKEWSSANRGFPRGRFIGLVSNTLLAAVLGKKRIILMSLEIVVNQPNAFWIIWPCCFNCMMNQVLAQEKSAAKKCWTAANPLVEVCIMTFINPTCDYFCSKLLPCVLEFRKPRRRLSAKLQLFEANNLVRECPIAYYPHKIVQSWTIEPIKVRML